MKLLLKFNLIFALVMVLGIALGATFSRSFLQQQARREVLDTGRLLMEQALAVRTYTSGQITRLLQPMMATDFLPQAVPNYAATEVLATLRTRYPEFAYKEATLNPVNPRNRAAGWEVDVVNAFRDAPRLDELVGERDTATGPALYVAHPLRVDNAACLACHGSPDAAPKSMVARYGSAGGLGWNLGEVVGAQVVSVPMALPLARGEQSFRLFVGWLIGVFVAVGVVLDALVWWFIVRPVTRLSALADRVSRGDLAAPEFATGSRDEIGVLAQSFARMRASVVQAMKMLDD